MAKEGLLNASLGSDWIIFVFTERFLSNGVTKQRLGHLGLVRNIRKLLRCETRNATLGGT